MAKKEKSFEELMAEIEKQVQADYAKAIEDDPFHQTEPLSKPQPEVEEIFADG